MIFTENCSDIDIQLCNVLSRNTKMANKENNSNTINTTYLDISYSGSEIEAVDLDPLDLVAVEIRDFLNLRT